MHRALGIVPPSPHSTPGHPTFPVDSLAKLIRRLRPQLIHSMEFQHAGYGVLKAKQNFSDDFPPWLATNWGSDIYLFRHHPEHRAIIQELLRSIDFYSCECERDVELARELGLTAPTLPVLPNSGGFDLDEIRNLNSGPTSKRRLIMVKGYQNFAGRAMTALDAVERCRDSLRHYDIVVFSAAYDVRDRVAAMNRNGWSIRAPAYLEHQEMLRSYGQARIYLGVNISDAISTSLLEAMAMGAFPIQTNTSCCDEWIEDGKSGFSIPPNDLEVITDRLRRALSDDELVDRAAAINERTVATRLDERILRGRALDFYAQIFEALDDSKRKEMRSISEL